MYNHLRQWTQYQKKDLKNVDYKIQKKTACKDIMVLDSYLSSSVQKLNFDRRSFYLDLTCNINQSVSIELTLF